MTNLTTAERLKTFQGMLSTCHKLFLRSYDNDFYSLGDETEEERLAEELFAISRNQSKLQTALAAGSTPLLFTSRVNMVWVCISAKSRMIASSPRSFLQHRKLR